LECELTLADGQVSHSSRSIQLYGDVIDVKHKNNVTMVWGYAEADKN